MSPMPQARTAGDVDVLEHSLVAAKMSVLRDKTSAPAKRSDDGAFVATGDVQSGVALRLPPHSKNSANGPYPTRGHSATAPFIREEQSPLLNKLFRQRHLIYDQVAALFNVMDFNPQILA
jgi:hypothetical protein